ncbi:MAG: hypothetical protein AAF721_25820 [Myxococcota bacterium]
MRRRCENGFAIGLVGATAALALLAGCGDDEAPSTEEAATGTGDAGTDETGDDTEVPLPEGHARVVHSFGTRDLGPAEEVQPCIQWTLGNEAPIYINKVTLTNDGGYHHSNWFIVPESYAQGDDGFFKCSDRNIGEIDAALAGTVLTAQSTQSRFETMELPAGVTVKAPPRHKVIAFGHLLNLSADEYPTELRMELEIIHPRMVEVVTAPLRLSYTGLDIPPFGESHFSGECDIKGLYEAQSGGPLDMKLYYVLPHYHYLGSYFDLSIFGGDRDGESVFRLDGFNADANGSALDPPLDLTGADGLRFTCGYDNWRDVSIGWGIGDQEMCVMLGLADSKVLMDASVGEGSVVGKDGDILLNEGNCSAIGLPKNPAQSMPTQAEIDAELYVPPSNDPGLPVVDNCKDIGPESAGPAAATLSNLRDTLLVSSCEFSSCHAGSNAVAGLDFRADDLHAELLGHTMSLTETDMPLVDPGNPDNSYLYQSITRCDPSGDGSEPHMPLNSAELVHPQLAAVMRGWIERGAPND